MSNTRRANESTGETGGRVAAPVQKLARLKDWRNLGEMFADNEVMKRIDEAERKLREENRCKTMPKTPKSKRRIRS